MTTELESTTGLAPFGWADDPAADDDHEGDTLFRFPAADDPAPSTRRVLLMSLSASALGLAGVGVGVRGFVSVLSGTAPGFYIPVLVMVGLISVALVVGAFLSIHRRALPFLLLVAATIPLTGDLWLAGSY